MIHVNSVEILCHMVRSTWNSQLYSISSQLTTHPWRVATHENGPLTLKSRLSTCGPTANCRKRVEQRVESPPPSLRAPLLPWLKSWRNGWKAAIAAIAGHWAPTHLKILKITSRMKWSVEINMAQKDVKPSPKIKTSISGRCLPQLVAKHRDKAPLAKVRLEVRSTSRRTGSCGIRSAIHRLKGVSLMGLKGGVTSWASIFKLYVVYIVYMFMMRNYVLTVSDSLSDMIYTYSIVYMYVWDFSIRKLTLIELSGEVATAEM